MRVESVRLGFATNSSSTHSILVGCSHRREWPDSGGFGWEYFHLKSQEDKDEYLAIWLEGAMRNALGAEGARRVVTELMGQVPAERYIDHQSQGYWVPRMYGSTNLPDREFVKDFIRFVRREDVSIASWLEEAKGIRIKEFSPNVDGHLYCYRPDIVARKNGKWWTLFNEKTGAKVRLSFDLEAAKPVCSSTPELVDVCITKKCSAGCSFCYQSASPHGLHADTEEVLRFAEKCRESQVFEVAIGGGEPTEHPDFAEILKAFREMGVVPNFSTRSLLWMQDEKIVEAVKAYCGGFAVSFHPGMDVESLIQWNHGRREARQGIASIQFPLGCYSWDEMWPVMSRTGISKTLLGFKDCGRAKKFEKFPYEKAMREMILEHKLPYGTSGDTLFVEQFGPELKQEDYSEMSFAGKEGAFSCYVDLVDGRAAASSYEGRPHIMRRSHPFERFPYVRE